MIFSSIAFLVYFLPIVLLIYFLLPNKLKNLFLLLASVFFYSWGAPLFIFVILLTTTLDFYLVKMMSESVNEKRRKLILVLSLSLNLGLLFYFKYCNFFIENLNHILSGLNFSEIKWLQVALPIGISFYTFESLTYVVDVYRRQHKPLDNFLQYQLYILLFPKLIAGPIIRFSEISDQITGRFQSYDLNIIFSGFFRFVIGLAKKILLANEVAKIAEAVFIADPATLGTAECWMGAIAYTFQIYFDFSGYSDMAIGLGKMFGFRFPENFNNPYASKSITEFWRRWHMSLGNWMKNYLYIPLGGNQVKTNSRLYFNLSIVFILSGFWHGASWTFIVWGMYYGFWLVVERVVSGRFPTFRRIAILSWIYTFLIVIIGWVFFRSNTISSAFELISRLFFYHKIENLHFNIGNKDLIVLSLCILFSVFIFLPYGQKVQDYFFHQEDKKIGLQYLITFFCFTLFILSLASITTSNFNPFIYFRF